MDVGDVVLDIVVVVFIVVVVVVVVDFVFLVVVVVIVNVSVVVLVHDFVVLFPCGGGGGWCKVIFVSTYVRLSLN